jgi:hypothetical protein
MVRLLMGGPCGVPANTRSAAPLSPCNVRKIASRSTQWDTVLASAFHALSRHCPELSTPPHAENFFGLAQVRMQNSRPGHQYRHATEGPS